MDYALITPPTEEPLSLAEAKAYCRVTHASEDAVITKMIRAARVQCENRARMSFITQTRRQSGSIAHRRGIGFGLPELSSDDPDEIANGMRLVRHPVLSIASVQSESEDGTLQTIANSHYSFDAPSATIRWKSGFRGACGDSKRIHVTYSAGLTVDDFAKHYPDIVDAILMLVEHKYTNRGAAENSMPKSVSSILDPYWSSTTYVA